MTNDQFTYLKMADDEQEFQEIREFLKAHGIEAIAAEKGFGSGPIREIFMGDIREEHIEILVKESQYLKSMKLLDFQKFNEELDEDLSLAFEDEIYN
ncbi:hypothetical protein Q5O24_15465 [Eubacteriaceae bacterium ES3]|nr:hypothetical protein Q5O24_15465 [Eubacteriaceae bacterium ES3]